MILVCNRNHMVVPKNLTCRFALLLTYVMGASHNGILRINKALNTQ